jgi:hypothetical protein
MSWKIVPWDTGCRIVEAAQFTTAIVRMLGKAVKFRHCPATVSAPASALVVLRCRRRQEFSQG